MIELQQSEITEPKLIKEDIVSELLKKRIPEDRIDELDQIQLADINAWRSHPAEGKVYTHFGKEIIVLPNVIPPFENSEPLVKSFKVRKGERVLDVGVGSGVLALNAALKKASEVVGIDINPVALQNTRLNFEKHGVLDKLTCIESDIFTNLPDGELFDVVMVNLPFRNKQATDLIECSLWDTDFRAHRTFFSSIRNYTHPKSRIYICQSNFGALDDFFSLVNQHGFKLKLLAEKQMELFDPRVFFAFELKQNS